MRGGSRGNRLLYISEKPGRIRADHAGRARKKRLVINHNLTTMKRQRVLYREKIYKCGNYTDVQIYPVFAPQGRRGKKRKPTAAAQQALNERNATQKFIRLINTNFTPKDIRIDLTYSPEHLPESAADALKRMQNYIRRVKRYRRAQGLPELKYVYVTEIGSKSGRIHHHCIMSGGVDISTLAEIWGNGYTTIKPLQFDEETGLEALARYMIKTKDKEITTKRWNASRNLKQPEVITRDGRISKAAAVEMLEQGFDGRAQIEKRYGACLANISPFFNDVNSGVYIALQLYTPKGGRKHDKQKLPTART